MANLREAERAVGDARGARPRQRPVRRRDELVERERGALRHRHHRHRPRRERGLVQGALGTASGVILSSADVLGGVRVRVGRFTRVVVGGIRAGYPTRGEEASGVPDHIAETAARGAARVPSREPPPPPPPPPTPRLRRPRALAPMRHARATKALGDTRASDSSPADGIHSSCASRTARVLERAPSREPRR